MDILNVKKLTIRLDEDLSDELALIADAAGTSVNRLVTQLIEQHVETQRHSPEARAAVAERISRLAAQYGLAPVRPEPEER